METLMTILALLYLKGGKTPSVDPTANGYINVNSPYGEKAILLSSYQLTDNTYGQTLEVV